jgi:hypothetical protein
MLKGTPDPNTSLPQPGVASILRTDVKAGFLSRRDNRTEPGVLTPGTDKKMSRPEGGGRTVVSDLCRRSQTKRRSEHLAPLQGASWVGLFLGLKPQAESYGPFRTSLSQKSKSSRKTKPDTCPHFRSHVIRPSPVIPRAFRQAPWSSKVCHSGCLDAAPLPIEDHCAERRHHSRSLPAFPLASPATDPHPVSSNCFVAEGLNLGACLLHSGHT